MEEFEKPESQKKITKDIRTYAEDLTQAIQSGSSSVREIISEQEKNELSRKEKIPKDKTNKNFLIVSSFLIVLSFLLLIFLFFYREKISSLMVSKPFTSIIFLDRSEFLSVDDLNKKEIYQTINNQTIIDKLKIGGIAGIYLTENQKVVGLTRFLELIQSDLIFDLNFVQDSFLIGILKNVDTENLFLLIKVRSFTDTFGFMQAWENKMFFDLHDFFGIPLNNENKYLLTKDFTDGFLQNKNARILFDDNEEIILFYLFGDDNSILIGNSPNLVSEILLRLTSSRIKK